MSRVVIVEEMVVNSYAHDSMNVAITVYNYCHMSEGQMPNWIIYNNRLVYPNYVNPTFSLHRTRTYSPSIVYFSDRNYSAGRKIISSKRVQRFHTRFFYRFCNRQSLFNLAVVFSFCAYEKRIYTGREGERTIRVT